MRPSRSVVCIICLVVCIIPSVVRITRSFLCISWFVVRITKNKEKAVQQILLHQVLLKRKYEVDDIIKGLKTLSLTEFLKRHPCVSPLLFSTESDVAVPTSVVLDKLTVDVDEPQPLEPNKLRAYGFLQDYIKDCEEKNTGKGYTILLLAVGVHFLGVFWLTVCA